MKKVITRFWGVGLIIVLLTSLFIAAAPASGADPLNWEFKTDSPSGAVWGLAPDTDVTDYDVNGATMYAALRSATNSADYLVQTTGFGVWTNITTRLPTAGVLGITEANDIDDIDFVAMAPDDPSVVVVADSTGNGTVAISVNAGASFSTMNFPGTSTTTILGIAVSPMVTGGIRYIAAYGRSGTSNDPALFYYNYGAGVGSWVEAVKATTWTGYTLGTDGAQDSIMAMEFSPNFPSDFMGVAVAANTGSGSANGTMDLHIMSFSSEDWDAQIAASYPVTSYTGLNAINVQSADVALLPDYDGSDDSLRIAFVGASILDAAEVGGVYRHYDNAPAVQIYGTSAVGMGINSLAYDGTTLACGAYASNNVFRSADPLATSPTFLPARSLKRIGLTGATDRVNLQFDGETLYGAKLGTASALSKSTDYGYTWNDFTLMDAGTPAALVGSTVMFLIGAGTIDDIYVTAAGDPWYMAAHTADNVTSVYRISMFAATRVLSIAGGTSAVDLILRGIDSDPDVVYAADEGGTVLYYTADGGLGRWYQRNNVPAAITDMAVESQGVVYIGNTVSVWKSVNSGFTWGIPVDSKLTGENIATMLSLGEDQLIVGGSNGGAAYTTDGGVNWSKTFGTGAAGGAGGVSHIAATGLAAGDFIYVAPAGANQVFRCEIGGANFLLEYRTMNLTTTASYLNSGMVLKDGVLYVVSSNTTHSLLNRTMAPTIPVTHPTRFWGTEYGPEGTLVFNLGPTALKASSGPPGSIMLQAVDTAFNMAYYLDDALALGGPSLIGPADGALIDIVSPVMGTPANVNFTWDRMSLATGYYLWIAMDAGFTELLGAPTAVGTTTVPNDFDPVSYIAAGSSFVPGTTYYWRVSTYLPLASGFSESRSFVIQPTAASVPTIASPENGGTIDSTSPAFSWTPTAGATMYQFQLSDDPAFGTTIADEQLASAGIAPAVTLDRGTTYFWRVRALQPVEGDWSTVANFVVAGLPPAPTPPVVIETVPAPVIEIPPAPPATVIEIPPAPPVEKIAPSYIWAIIIIGAVLVIAVIVLIVRTRRQV